MESVAGAGFPSINSIAVSRYRNALPGKGYDIPFQSHRSKFCQQLAAGGKILLNSHDVECQARPNNRNISSVNFYEYLQGNKDSSFLERLVQAWHILFPSKQKPVSNAEIAKQRLKMILISDRCAISDEAKRRIVDNVVGALSNFVEIESQEKVQLNVSADPDLGTVYSVIVPVRRVKTEYQDYSENLRNIKYGDAIGQMRTVDVRFEYPDDVE